MDLPVHSGGGKPGMESDMPDLPRLGNLGDALEKYSVWLSTNISPPPSPTLRAASPAPASISDSARLGGGAEPFITVSPSSDSDVSPSLQSKSSQSRRTRTTVSSPPSSHGAQHPSPIAVKRQLYVPSPHTNQPSPSKTSKRARQAAQLTPAQPTPAQVLQHAQPALLPVQLLMPLHSPSLLQGAGANSILPLYWASKAQKYAVLQQKLALLSQTDRAAGELDPDGFNAGIHVFVDLSNITIGFYDLLKRNRGIPVTKRIPAPPFSFENFALVLERARPVVKRVVAGSLVSTNLRQRPMYMQEAEECGYEMNILQRVQKDSPVPSRRSRRFNGSDVTWTTTSGGDTSDDGRRSLAVQQRQAEQGVDEILHLKIMQSLVDCEDTPGTIVLATGDAAEAEFSDGFKSNVERALHRGWTVELHAWSSGTSSSWTDAEFKHHWGNKFRIIELDAFAEELLGVWTG